MTNPEISEAAKAHRWDECEMCGPMVICGRCGNNCCNGGYGTLSDGSQCPSCPSAYDMQAAQFRTDRSPKQ